MAVEEIFNQLGSHMVEGMMMHSQMANAYGFLKLDGYKTCHEYHYLEETKMYICLNSFYQEQYHKLIKLDAIPNPEIIPASWYKYTSADVDTSTKRSAVETMIKKWVEWEQSTKDILQIDYKILYDSGDILAADKIKCMLDDVTDELHYAEKKKIELTSVNYDIGFILNEQDRVEHKCKKKINNLFIEQDW